MRKVVCVLFLFYISFLCIIGSVCYESDIWNEKTISTEVINFSKDKDYSNKQKYVNCLSKPYVSKNIDSKFKDAFENLKSNGVAIYFEDINNEYSWEMNSNKVYYSASTSKIFDVIYLIEQARKNKIDLNNTLTYDPIYARNSSKGMKNHSFYDKVTILKLIEYVLTYSDNSAHAMLVDYIGIDTLKSYFSDFNLEINEYNPYVRNYTATMAKKSLERMYELWQVDDDYTALVKKSMNNSILNYLKFDNTIIYHKYGLYEANFHDIGIYDGEYPYIIVVLTQYGNLERGIYGTMVKYVSEKVHSIYENNLKDKEAYCEQVKNDF